MHYTSCGLVVSTWVRSEEYDYSDATSIFLRFSQLTPYTSKSANPQAKKKILKIKQIFHTIDYPLFLIASRAI